MGGGKEKMKIANLMVASLLLFSGCSGEKKERKKEVAGMKCGAGKCGANMFDGNRALAKKRSNILKQLSQDDPRVECVKTAKTTKALYDCVRNPMSGKLSLKCGSTTDTGGMKCGDGKCGASMTIPKPAPKKADTQMKCDGSMDM